MALSGFLNWCISIYPLPQYPAIACLLTFIDVRLNHHAHNPVITLFDLIRQYSGDLGLVLMVLLTVAMRAVDHQSVAETFRP